MAAYSALDKPTQMAKDGATTDIFYGPDRARYKRVDTTSGGTVTTTTYVAGRLYEVVSSGDNVS
ncbi:MAG: hypothetical protein GY788_20310 [bacterium]|nr:hypothetical protein [bacterium]